jgi:dUTP pyrophosphatase
MFNVKIKVDDESLWPQRAHVTDAGADLRSVESRHLGPGEQYLFNTGVAIKIPEGFVGMVFNRSSQGKIGVQIANGTGIIDSDYRGNIHVLLRNTGTEYYTVKAKETRIAQLVIVPIVLPNFIEHMRSETWDDTARSTGGFGSTGV